MKAKDLNLAELMQFTQGRVELHGRRMILHDLQSLGQFRRDLIEMMGLEQAQRILTRKGFFWGQTDAATMQRLYQWDDTEEWLKAGTMLTRLTGLCEGKMHIRTLDLASGRVDLEMVWRNSSEFEQHLSELGPAPEPICWALVGYASGYASYCVGRSVYFLETQCQATGAACCVTLGKDLASWGPEIQPYLSFFHAADIQKRVRELTEQIEKQQRELERNRRELAGAKRAPEITPVEVRSPAFQKTLELAARVAKFDTTVLVTGETGAGKEVIARYLHQCSPRAGKPMLAINCSAMPETLLESELFGHRAGAFTGATRNHLGLFEEADGGTVFLDEIGDISAAMQVKLLRVLQEREVKRIGESHARAIDVRVISATNQHLERLVAEGRFREDLFYRLNVVQIEIPPLRDRREDILPLARHFLKRCALRLKLPDLRLAPACVDVLLQHPWPGNVRQLENVIEQAAVLCPGGVITPEHLPLARDRGRIESGEGATSAYRSLEDVELDHIRRVLELTGGNRTETAKILQIGEATLYRKLRQIEQRERGRN